MIRSAVVVAAIGIAALSGARPAFGARASRATSLESLVTELRLENGLTILVVERPESPTIGLATCFRVGAAEEHRGVYGVTHILEHMLFKGTTEIGTKDWEAEKPHLDRIEELTSSAERERAKGAAADTTLVRSLLDERAREIEAANEPVVDNELMGIYARNGGVGVNAFTSYDATAYILALPSNRLELWMHLESERLRRPVLRQFYTEIRNILEERRLRVDSDPQGTLQEAFLAAAFDAHGYGYPIIGYPSDIESVTLTETEAWCRRYYAPNRVTLAVVGDVKAESVRALAQKYFGDLPAQEPPEPMETIELPKTGPRRVGVEFDAEPRLLLGWHKANAPDPDDAALRVVSEILTGGSSGRLTKSLVQGRELAASIETDHEFPGTRWPNLFMIEALPRAPHTTAELESALWSELEKLRRDPLPERELQKAKNRIRAEFVRGLESNFGLAVALGVAQASFQDWRVLLESQRAVETVTPEDVLRVARATFRKPRTITAALEKPVVEADPARETEGRRIVERMLKALGGRERLARVESAESSSRVAITTGGGALTAEAKSWIAPPDRARSEMTVFGQTSVQGLGPGGAWRTQQGRVVGVEGDEARTFRAELERDLFLLAYPRLETEYAVASLAAGNDRAVEVRGPSGRTFLVTLDEGTGLPSSVAYEGTHPLTGAKARFLEAFDDWRGVNGVKRPHRVVTTIDGEPFAESTTRSMTLDAPIDANTFVKPAG